jgi:tetratricopeptide (TPR) repeat protein
MRMPPMLAAGLVLLSLPLAAQAPGLPRRELRVLVIADEEYRADPQWMGRTLEMIRESSAEFEKQFNIRLRASPFESWGSDDSLQRMDFAAETLARDFDRLGADILVVMSGQEWRGDSRMSYVLYKEGLIFLAPPPRLANLSDVFNIQLGRLFGAVNVPDPGDLPKPGDLPTERSYRFSAADRELILLNRDRTFNRPDSPSFPVGSERALEIYRSVADTVEARLAAREAAQTPGVELSGTEGVVVRPVIMRAGEVHLLLAQLYLNAGHLDEAMSCCATALKLDPDNLEAQNTLGIIYRRTGDLESAIRKYLEIFRHNPEFARVLFNLGVAYAQQGDLSNAAAAYEAALSLRPAYAEALNNIGDVRARQGRFDEAVRLFRRSVAANPGWAMPRINLADLLLRTGDAAGAGAEADEAARLDPGSTMAALVQGNVDRAAGLNQEAAAHYLRARALDPRNTRATINLGILAFGRGAFGQSEQLFCEALAADPAAAEAHAGLGACLIKKNDLEAARQELGAALAGGLNTPDIHLNLSTIALAKKSYDEAIAEAKLALGLDANLGDAYRNLSDAYLQKGLKKEAGEARAAAARLASEAVKRSM